MTFWRRLFGRPAARSEPGPDDRETAAGSERGDASRRPASTGPRPEATTWRALREVGEPAGPDAAVALSLLRAARGTSDEGAALSALLAAPGPLSEELRVAAAELLSGRGEPDDARRVLLGASSAAGLILLGDLYADSGAIGRALGVVERVLARDLDAPGARERHDRWRALLGDLPARRVAAADETLLRSDLNEIPLEIRREIARGGAGTVYEAFDRELGRRTALKVYHLSDAAEKAVRREAVAATKLAGPGVVVVFDAHPSGGWLTLEWAAGGSLRDRLQAGAVHTLWPLAGWVGELARALRRVHRLGWVHGDVKPANVLFREGMEVVLSDFGIARPIGGSPLGGSAGYTSPERLDGGACAPSDDVYGFGRILEDALDRLEDAHSTVSADERAPWREVADRCLSPAGARPTDGDALSRLLGARDSPLNRASDPL